ncbi:TPA: hypothetical protein I7255_14320 [Vibrio vulnificus]|nr:hypothetical protein [Vibrio vulnificus]HAS6403810.1 hypothetical protein [Vibrio vulnificus]
MTTNNHKQGTLMKTLQLLPLALAVASSLASVSAFATSEFFAVNSHHEYRS